MRKPAQPRLAKEGLIPLSAVPDLVAELYPYWPTSPTHQTAWRWTKFGVGESRLEAIKILNVIYTSEPAVRRFCDGMMAEETVSSP